MLSNYADDIFRTLDRIESNQLYQRTSARIRQTSALDKL